MLVDIFNNSIKLNTNDINNTSIFYKTLYPQLWKYFENLRNKKINLLFNTLFYINGIDINSIIISLFKYAYNTNELKTELYNDSYEYYYNNSFFLIDCKIFYGKMLLDFLSEIVDYKSFLDKNIFIFSKFELLDRYTQNDIISKGYRSLNTSNFIFISQNYVSCYSKINLFTIKNPNFNMYKTYLQYFIEKQQKYINLPFFEPVLDKIILSSNNDIYQMLFVIEIFKYDPNVINRYLLENDIHKIAQIIKSKLITDYPELREILYTLLEKSNFKYIITTIIEKLLPLLNLNIKQYNKIISSINTNTLQTNLPNKHIYILECIISDIIYYINHI